MTASARLSDATAEVVRPTSSGIVHLGVGAFHRAHQAAFTHEAVLLTGETYWGITGFTQRSNTVVDQLAPQDGLFTLVQKGTEETTATVVGSILDVRNAAANPDAVVEAIADPATHIVTLTVTEKGYRLDPASGRLRLDDPEIAADLAGRPPHTVAGQLVAGLARRMAGDAPLTVLCCDNLPSNGRILSELVRVFVEARGMNDGLAEWISRRVAFPSSMVDRIVPATADEDRADNERRTGLRDDALVVCEPFRQWVIEDDFAGPRPAWERVGVQFVEDVEPWETMKLRVLNATHSVLAYLGILRGHNTIAEAVQDPELDEICRAMVLRDVAPTTAGGMDAVGYGNEVRTRFANPALKHTTRQVAMDGSQKLGPRLLGTVRDATDAGGSTDMLALAVAAWCAFVLAETEAGRALDDPLSAQLARAGSASDLLAVESIFGSDLGPTSPFGTQVVAWTDFLRTNSLGEWKRVLV
ncbi:mannitol dehydrogenase family protein [Rhodococcus fascians]|nr:mannitol dehydrogenase family protein [Rhodococcus fascians]MBY4235468.1 mannitol dehydrogenase family protein [Rhodococcus fascians]MBY4251160.1 mannitol dehydrogenase family protein [Rhodococcus fascians]MBY4266815.1 mannitol dehydrogenase family protein [Rhodococcus fascians]